MSWKEEAERLRFDDGLSWTEITTKMKKHFPDLTEGQVREKIRSYIRTTDRYKKAKGEPAQPKPYRSSIEYRNDGSLISDKIIEICENQKMTPEFLLEAHGLSVLEWDVISYKNNYWHSQVKGGTRLVMYQSKITVKPKANGISLEEIDKHFAKLDRTYKPPKYKPIHRNARNMAEVNIADLHFGKLCWHGNTGNNYDHKIAKQMYIDIINEIYGELKGREYEYILFPFGNDFFNSDNEDKTTSAGTPQETDVRHQKLFNVGMEAVISGIDLLSEIAPVKIFLVPSNHDKNTGYYAIKYLEAWYRHDTKIDVNIDAKSRKYFLFGNMHLGFTHGDKEGKESKSKEKASRLASTMPIESPDMWAKAKYHEIHAAHLHSEHAIEEINGVIVRRISSPTATDTYHYDSAYIGSVRKAQTFIYDKERGLVHTINTPVDYKKGVMV